MDFLFDEYIALFRFGIGILLFLFVIYFLPKYIAYTLSTYRKDTKKSAFKVLNDVVFDELDKIKKEKHKNS